MSATGALASRSIDREYFINLFIAKLYGLTPAQDDFSTIQKDISLPSLFEGNLDKVKSIFGHTIVHICAMRGLRNILEGLIAYCAQNSIELDLNYKHSVERFSALHLACARADADFAEMLLSHLHGVGVCDQDLLGNTPAHVVSFNVSDVEKREKVLAVLRRYTSSVAVVNNDGKTFEQMERRLLFKPALNALGQTQLHYVNNPKILATVQKSNLRDLKLWVNKGDARCLRTPLMYMTIRSNISAASFLCDLGADVNMGDYRCQTALHYAALLSSPEMFAFLLSKGGDPFQPDKDGNTPESIANRYGRTEIIRLIQQKKEQDVISSFEQLRVDSTSLTAASAASSAAEGAVNRPLSPWPIALLSTFLPASF
ncbi:MAG: ankyrin repeat domain-containing protein, partial [Proteobacteria bacterium]|nr:ankyrin repeat domain-containing protein [Pseudomonadota bacterium]